MLQKEEKEIVQFRNLKRCTKMLSFTNLRSRSIRYTDQEALYLVDGDGQSSKLLCVGIPNIKTLIQNMHAKIPYMYNNPVVRCFNLGT